MKAQSTRRADPEVLLVVQLAAFVSILSFLFYLRKGDVLPYGDAVAHINIARRVFDSRTPGLLQLGTVWLPLPHLLMIPFLVSDWAWQTGVGGSIPSLVAHVFSVLGIFRLVRGALAAGSEPSAAMRITAWGAAIIFAANPNLIYLQATAMTEPLYLALFIWAVVHFSEFLHKAQVETREACRSLLKSGFCLAGACLTRYDGWFLAAAIGAAALVVVARNGNSPGLRAAFAKFVLISAAAPIFWLAYNAAVYRNPLEFVNGPYSAKAIEEKTSIPGFPPHPGSHNLPVAAAYFLKAAELNMLESNWHRLWLWLALAGTALAVFPIAGWFTKETMLGRPDRLMNNAPSWCLWPSLLLWTPLPFYMLSIAYSGVPLFVPPWWPFSIYNARYGVQLLPVFAVFIPLSGYFLARHVPSRYRPAVPLGILALTITSYGLVWHKQPVSYREAWINSRTRIALEHQLASTMKALPSNATFLMYLGDHVGALQDAGIPLRRVINEGNHRPWKQPVDPEGLWELSLANPERYADYVIAIDKDAISQQVQKQGLTALQVIHVTGQPVATIYSTHARQR